MIKLLTDFFECVCALCSKTDIQQVEKNKNKDKKMHRLTC